MSDKEVRLDKSDWSDFSTPSTPEEKPITTEPTMERVEEIRRFWQPECHALVLLEGNGRAVKNKAIEHITFLLATYNAAQERAKMWEATAYEDSEAYLRMKRKNSEVRAENERLKARLAGYIDESVENIRFIQELKARVAELEQS